MPKNQNGYSYITILYLRKLAVNVNRFKRKNSAAEATEYALLKLKDFTHHAGLCACSI